MTAISDKAQEILDEIIGRVGAPARQRLVAKIQTPGPKMVQLLAAESMVKNPGAPIAQRLAALDIIIDFAQGEL